MSTGRRTCLSWRVYPAGAEGAERRQLRPVLDCYSAPGHSVWPGGSACGSQAQPAAAAGWLAGAAGSGSNQLLPVTTNAVPRLHAECLHPSLSLSFPRPSRWP